MNVLVKPAHLPADADSHVAAAIAAEAHVHHRIKIDAPYPCVDSVVNDERHKAHVNRSFRMRNRIVPIHPACKRGMNIGDGGASQKQTPKVMGIRKTVLSATAQTLVHDGHAVGTLNERPQNLQRKHRIFTGGNRLIYGQDMAGRGLFRGLVPDYGPVIEYMPELPELHNQLVSAS
jgi:hypothetical protein